MSINILKRKNIISIYVMYDDGLKRKVGVDVNFVDEEVCYLYSAIFDKNIVKPKQYQKAEILVNTLTGTYIGKSKILDTTITLHQIIFELELPKKWDSVLSRDNVQKHISVPFTIKYDDGFEIIGKTKDITLNGIFFTLKEAVLPDYFKLNAKLTLDFSNYKGFQNLDNFKCEVLFSKDLSFEDDIAYIYRYVTLDTQNLNILKLLLDS